ncbi:RNA polymerase sigma factor SigJ [Streptomyces sp. B6B3]|uniref:RNA polymerase sigma factor SigJ n=1 Tax=Streptomyces sp. B6B3 TaxID=3153570 RepID=UPI00325D66F9
MTTQPHQADRPVPAEDRTDPGLSAIMHERRHLTGLAYRMLGSLAEAEDVVQETYARWYALPGHQREAINAPGGWLTTVASRICLNILGSARARRERYVGAWIPEPLPDHPDWSTARPSAATADPADRVTLDESITMAFLVVLESMTPAQRVAFVLHDVFRYTFNEVAEIVGRTPAACRQLASAARRRIRAEQPTAVPPTAQQADVVRAFRQAWQAKDIDALVGLLDPDASAIGDGGGVADTLPRPVHGSEQVAQAYLAIAHAAPRLTVLERTVNGQPGLLVRHGDLTVAVLAFDIVGDRIRHIWSVRNPEKLRPWATGQDTRTG